jgi:NTP pyrophosphatase (non-canonical NTP hydrolase)
MLRISRLPRAGNGAAQDGDSDGAMDIQQLTEAMNRFVRSKGWYEKDSPRPQTPRNLAVSLSLESAEVLEHFQWDPPASPAGGMQQKDALAEELADVALYLLQLASVLGIDLEQAILHKLDKNYSRRWPASPSEDKAAK